MLGALFVESYIRAFFGLTAAAAQVAGGLVVISTSWRCFIRVTRNVPADSTTRHRMT